MYRTTIYFGTVAESALSTTFQEAMDDVDFCYDLYDGTVHKITGFLVESV